MKTGLESAIWTVGLRLKTHDLSDVLNPERYWSPLLDAVSDQGIF